MTDDEAPANGIEQVTIPSTGLTYWEYRRACFLAGVPFPHPSTPATTPPPTYTVPPAPEPKAAVPYRPAQGSSIGRLEALLSEFGAEESAIAWNGGVGGVARNLAGGRKLAKGLRLGLVIKVLRAVWIRDGTWPVDPVTRTAARPAPDSPVLSPSAQLEAESRPQLPLPVRAGQIVSWER